MAARYLADRGGVALSADLNVTYRFSFPMTADVTAATAIGLVSSTHGLPDPVRDIEEAERFAAQTLSLGGVFRGDQTVSLRGRLAGARGVS